MRLSIIILGIGVLVASAGVIFFTTLKGSGTVNAELSGRAEEFIKTQREQGNPDWIQRNLNQKDVKTNQTINDKTCFSFYSPLIVTIKKRLDSCFYDIAISLPKGHITVYERASNLTTIDQDSGVMMRRVEEDIYQESSVVINGREYLTFRKSGPIYEKNAFYLHGSKLFVLNLLVPTDQDLDAEFLQMLTSLVFYTE